MSSLESRCDQYRNQPLRWRRVAWILDPLETVTQGGVGSAVRGAGRPVGVPLVARTHARVQKKRCGRLSLVLRAFPQRGDSRGRCGWRGCLNVRKRIERSRRSGEDTMLSGRLLILQSLE